MKKAVSIQDIAEALGMSRNTVSKALNGQRVPKKTRDMVFEKARELNYKSFGSQEFSAKSQRILLLSGKIFRNMQFFVPLVDAIERACLEHGVEFFQYVCKDDKDSFKKTAAYLESLHIDGIIVIECFKPSFVQKLTSIGIPCCFIDYPWQNFEIEAKIDLLCSSSQKSVSDYVEHLVRERGFNSFSFVGDFRHCLSFYQRYMGMVCGLQKTNVPHSAYEDILEEDGKFLYGDVPSLKRKISELPKLPNCFVCCNDFVARRVAMALAELDYSIPEDTTIVGYDGAPCATQESPTITTFYIDKVSAGLEALRLVLSRIMHKEIPKRMVIVEADLILGKSTKKISSLLD